MKKIAILTILILVCIHLYAQGKEKPRPNIVLILADDVALMDFGAYGGEASTPNIDKLANQGTMFTNYHASPMCAPSRAMLLTGYDSHLTGVPNLPIFLPPEYTKKPGYECILNNKVKTVATRLKEAGYRTYMTGKWHLGHTENTLPSKRGFDRTFIFDASGADNYEDRSYLPSEGKPTWFQDGKPTKLPKDFYSSRTLVDKMIEFMEAEKDKTKPFFSYLAFQAVHIPLQAPKEFIDKYENVYEGGWHEMRQKRFENAKRLGLIPKNAKLGDMLPQLKKWEELTDKTRKMASKSMAVNAAMLEAMDFHIGRYMAYLEKIGELDNTVFIVTSDNGPEASDPSLVGGMSLWLKSVGYSRDYETLGEKGTYSFIGPEFASAAASPSAFFKFYASEGGLRVPLIICGQKYLPIAKKETAFSFITDVTPTILSIANALPDPSMTGRSLLPLINNEDSVVYSATDAVGMEAASQAALFRGNMKLTRNGKAYGDGVWRLYNIAIDPGETTDLSASEPALFAEMLAAYEAYAQKNGVLKMPENYDPIQETANHFIRKVKAKALPWVVAFFVLIVGFVIWRKRRKNRSRNLN
jgi:arylsulfatase A-like enzyme